MKGLTGEIKFDTNGLRSDFTVQIYELNSHGKSNVGTWDPENGLAITKALAPPEGYIDDSAIRNMSFVVITAIVSN